jgi:hypothetical protein
VVASCLRPNCPSVGWCRFECDSFYMVYRQMINAPKKSSIICFLILDLTECYWRLNCHSFSNGMIETSTIEKLTKIFNVKLHWSEHLVGSNCCSVNIFKTCTIYEYIRDERFGDKLSL